MKNRQFIGGNIVSDKTKKKLLDFSETMAYSYSHKENKNGSEIIRSPKSVENDVFLGKTGEILFHSLLAREGIHCPHPDFSVKERGIWENSDFSIYGKKISIKTAKHFSDYLMLPEREFCAQGLFLGKTKIDYFVFARVQILGDIRDINSIVRAELTGYITFHDFISLRKNQKNIIKKGQKLGKTIVDVDNFIVSTIAMHPIPKLFSLLKNLKKNNQQTRGENNASI